MTPALTILSHAVTEHACAMYLTYGDRLELQRRPHSRNDRYELAMFKALLPVIRRYPGDRVRIRREVEANLPRWLFPLDVALFLPDWWLARCEPLPDLVALWTAGRALHWQLPTGTEPRPLTVLTMPRDNVRQVAA